MEQYNYMPIGTVVSYAGATTPIGWLLCDGRTIEEHEYPDLYRVLGSGILPDLRGEFGQIIKAFNTTTDTETLPIQMAKALNNKIENNYNDQLDATVDIVGKEFYDYIQNSGEKTAGKIYRDRLQKGIFRCLKTTTSVLNTSEFFESISNNDLLSLVSTTILKGVTYKKYSDGTMTAEGIVTFSIPTPNSGIVSNWITFDIPFVDNKYIPIVSAHGGASSLSNVSVAIDNPIAFANDKFLVYGMRVRMDVPFDSGYLIAFFVTGKYK